MNTRASASRRPVSVLVLGLVALALAGPLAAPVWAGPMGSLARWLLGQGARHADDVGKRTLRELTEELEHLAAKAGDDVVEAAVRTGKPGALRLLRTLGHSAPEGARILARHGAAGRLLLEEAPDAALNALRTHGDEGIRTLVRLGASRGGRMLNTYGKASRALPELSDESLTHLSRWSADVDRMPADWQRAFLDNLGAYGDRFVAWAHANWGKVLIVGGSGVALLTAFRAGDALVGAIPNPAEDPVGWFLWWTPILAALGLVLGVVYVRAACRRRSATADTPVSAPTDS